MKPITKRQVEILRGIARGGVLQHRGWLYYRPRANQRRGVAHCTFRPTVYGDLTVVTAGLVDKMERRGLIELFKPHVGAPRYRLTRSGNAALCKVSAP